MPPATWLAACLAAWLQEIVINTVSSKNDYSEQMAMLRPDGTLCLVGLPVDNVSVGVLDLVFNQKKVRGWVGACGWGTVPDMGGHADYCHITVGGHTKYYCEVLTYSTC